MKEQFIWIHSSDDLTCYNCSSDVVTILWAACKESTKGIYHGKWRGRVTIFIRNESSDSGTSSLKRIPQYLSNWFYAHLQMWTMEILSGTTLWSLIPSFIKILINLRLSRKTHIVSFFPQLCYALLLSHTRSRLQILAVCQKIQVFLVSIYERRASERNSLI